MLTKTRSGKEIDVRAMAQKAKAAGQGFAAFAKEIAWEHGLHVNSAVWYSSKNRSKELREKAAALEAKVADLQKQLDAKKK